MSCMSYQNPLFLLICSVVCMSNISDKCTTVLLNYNNFFGVQFLSGHSVVVTRWSVKTSISLHPQVYLGQGLVVHQL